MWEDEYISKNMLKAHLDENYDSATRKLEFVRRSVDWISETLPPSDYPALLDLGCGPGIYGEFFSKKGMMSPESTYQGALSHMRRIRLIKTIGR